MKAANMMNRMTNIGDLLSFSQSTYIVLFSFFFVVLLLFWQFDNLTACERRERCRSVFSFPYLHPLGLVVNKSPVVFIFIRALDDRLRENSRSGNRLVASRMPRDWWKKWERKMALFTFPTTGAWRINPHPLDRAISFPNTYPLVSGLSGHSGG